MRYSLLCTALLAVVLTACNSATTTQPTGTPVSQNQTATSTTMPTVEATASITATTPTASTTSMTDTMPMTSATSLTDTTAITGTTPLTDTTAITETTPTTNTMPMTNTASMTRTTSLTDTMAITGTTPMTHTTPTTDTMPLTDTMQITVTSAMAELKDAEGNIVGTANFSETQNGVDISVAVTGLLTATAGEHGIHIHQVGACTPDFAAAGAHYNPTDAKHGSKNRIGPHAGDLPNITFDAAGNATYSATSQLFTISGDTSLLAADGSAIVIHAKADDYVTDPSGMSGARIACGVLMAKEVEPMAMSSEPPPPPGGTLNTPKHRTATPENIASLQVPKGFTVSVFAEGLDNARMMAQHASGAVYVTRRAQGDVVRIADKNGDGIAEPFTVAVADIPLVQGIIITGDQVYLGTPKTIYSGKIQADGRIGDLKAFVNGLPDPGQHANATIAFGPDGNLYVSNGSSCNACSEGNPEHATIVQVKPDGSSRGIYANGLRNTLGWAWHPKTGDLWGMDHGSDWRGDDQPPEELNRIEQGKNYGWPYCYGNKNVDRYLATNPPGRTKAEFCAASTAPVLTYQAHSAPIAMVFYTGDKFPAEYQNSAFVTMHGSWNRTEPTGYNVVWVRFVNGQPVEFSDFLSGFLLEDQRAFFGRPAGLLVTQDGSLLVSDDVGGTVYQIRYTGK